MNRFTPLALTALLALAACGDDDGPLAPGSSQYTLQIQGAMVETATGPAYFGSDVDDDGQPVWVLLLGSATSRHLVMAAKPGSDRPGTGTVQLQDPESTTGGWTALHLVSEGEELLAMYVAESGSITFSSSSAGKMTGTLQFRAVGLLDQASDTVDVTGSFTAVPAPASTAAARAAAGIR